MTTELLYLSLIQLEKVRYFVVDVVESTRNKLLRYIHQHFVYFEYSINFFSNGDPGILCHSDVTNELWKAVILHDFIHYHRCCSYSNHIHHSVSKNKLSFKVAVLILTSVHLCSNNFAHNFY